MMPTILMIYTKLTVRIATVPGSMSFTLLNPVKMTTGACVTFALGCAYWIKTNLARTMENLSTSAKLTMEN